MLWNALPFAFSFSVVPFIVMAAIHGGWWVAAPFVWGWIVIGSIDQIVGMRTDNLDPDTAESDLIWHKRITWVWVPGQVALILFVLWQITQPDHLSTGEAIGVALGLGIATGTIGITFAHELVHQRNRWERLAGELLLTSVAYGHFATEHVLGHHVTVGTPKDPVTARKGQDFYSFFVQAVGGQLLSAWRLDRNRLARIGLPVWHRRNPFWRYGLGLAAFLGAAFAVGGLWGIALYGIMCFMAIYQLEATNYVEHYGLSRMPIGNGRHEPVAPHHSWNASHQVSNWMMINLQRHSDHHCRPDRRFALLQHQDEARAPQLPASYPSMIACALYPAAWFRTMDDRVDQWRATFYPDVEDWSGFETGTKAPARSATAKPA